METSLVMSLLLALSSYGWALVTEVINLNVTLYDRELNHL
jgi:hypothetical protein